jgi:hypothetical protein
MRTKRECRPSGSGERDQADRRGTYAFHSSLAATNSCSSVLSLGRVCGYVVSASHDDSGSTRHLQSRRAGIHDKRQRSYLQHGMNLPVVSLSITNLVLYELKAA